MLWQKNNFRRPVAQVDKDKSIHVFAPSAEGIKS